MKKILIITIAVGFIQCEPIVPQQSTVTKRMLFDNHNYEDLVGMVQMVPYENQQPTILENQVVSLEGSTRLLLSFDLLTDQFENLSAKIFHCNKDWTQSRLREMEYLSEINNFRITDFDYSVNTVQPYIHYQLVLPKPILSGNYVVAVYRRANPEDILFTRRFLVYTPKAVINHQVGVSSNIEKRNQNQQISFEINYGNLLVNIPTRDISAVILQNHNWYTAISNIAPTLIRADQGFIAYRHVDMKTNFYGWNEFRFTDLRTLSVASRNVAKITNDGVKFHARLSVDKSRGKLPYTQNFQDINGNYVIQNNDPGESFLNADYADATFTLQAEASLDGDVYVIGRFNNWQLTDKNRMNFLQSGGFGRYETTIPLKQGYYEYMYYVESESLPPYYFEGSHFQTENEYEILIYYRRPGNINDELIGYKKFRSIER